ncbi:MAG: hypothetical protein JSV64_00985 [Candidatus Bathyarchaeota archaeon]|nr:MAG: hypothetical protein JSV64_00985 [Candidatus Bathyarchaeota archaeon]
MNSKTIAVIVVFAALTIVLNLPIKIPAPYATFLIYQIWEIPIVAAFLLFGFKVGSAISIINTAMLLAIFPGELPTGPFYNLAAVLSMLFGIYLTQKFLKVQIGTRHRLTLPVVSTAVGIFFRVAFMTIVNWTFLPFEPPVGFGLPLEFVVAQLPVIAFFNATLALYTIPVGYFLAEVAGSSMKYVGLNRQTNTKTS